MPREAAKRMKPELMWAWVRPDGRMFSFPLWDRAMLRDVIRDEYGLRIVRVRVTQYKRKRNAP